MKFLGDVHGKFDCLPCLTSEVIYQVGDMGIGFGIYNEKMLFDRPDVKFIRGNHDNPRNCKAFKDSYLGDYGCDPGMEFFWMGGAMSIDRSRRTEGVDWWRDEELSYSGMLRAHDLYVKSMPSIVMTHDCPEEVMKLIHPSNTVRSTTRNCLQSMFEKHQPKHWVFGHHHNSLSFSLKGTEFRCVNELEIYEIK
jgi:hypothetical protein